MHDLIVETRKLRGSLTLSKDLAQHLLVRSNLGKVVVLTDRPIALLSAVRKQWLKLEHRICIDRAKTLNSNHIAELTNQLIHMQDVSFTAKLPEDVLEADITFVTVDDLIPVAPDCKTMYVTYVFPREKLYMVTSWMPRNSLVVLYDKE